MIIEINTPTNPLGQIEINTVFTLIELLYKKPSISHLKIKSLSPLLINVTHQRRGNSLKTTI